MATYIMLTRLTDKGAETIKEKPGRIEAVAKEVEAFGVKVVAAVCRARASSILSTSSSAPDHATVARVLGGTRVPGQRPHSDAAGGAGREFVTRFKKKWPGPPWACTSGRDGRIRGRAEASAAFPVCRGWAPTDESLPGDTRPRKRWRPSTTSW